MLGGRMVWVGMSRGRFVGGRNVKAPSNAVYSFDGILFFYFGRGLLQDGEKGLFLFGNLVIS
jgi:hypothetical protein